jgi:hypothetical protein
MHRYHYDVSHGASAAQISLDIITALAQQNALEEQNAFALAQILSNSLRKYRKLNRKVSELRILKIVEGKQTNIERYTAPSAESPKCCSKTRCNRNFEPIEFHGNLNEHLYGL